MSGALRPSLLWEKIGFEVSHKEAERIRGTELWGLFHVRGVENLKDFASNLFIGMGMLRKFEDSDIRLLACECGESVG